ncbi:hypothetical protein NX059_004759 [Plenodomus lindquistii]|nr:hypothetical protein NX059_004759 [Plenodomus lindquistii]
MLPFRILDLPPEIVGEICEHLEDSDLPNFRRVCKAFEAHSCTAFGKRFFHHLVAILHPTSLTTLLEIARHVVFAKFVDQVTISGETIGQSLCVQDNDEGAHVSLQRSMANSGLDVMILTEVFRALRPLHTIRIDLASFSNGGKFEYYDDGMKSGRRYMQVLPDDSTGQRGPGYGPGFNRVYGIVLKALHQARLQQDFSFEMMFCRMEDCDDPVSFFGLDSAEWSEFSKNVHEIEYLGCMDPVWIAKFLTSAPDVRGLQMSGVEGVLTLPVGLNHWTQLSRLELDELFLRHEEFTPLIRPQRDTLKELHLQAVGFVGGTWIEPLKIISNMRRLE